MFEILVIVSVNVINLVVLVNIQIIQAVCVDPLLKECTENINEKKLVNITVENKNNVRCRSYVVYKVPFWIFFVISCVTIIYIVYHVYVNRIKYNLPYES